MGLRVPERSFLQFLRAQKSHRAMGISVPEGSFLQFLSATKSHRAMGIRLPEGRIWRFFVPKTRTVLRGLASRRGSFLPFLGANFPRDTSRRAIRIRVPDCRSTTQIAFRSRPKHPKHAHCHLVLRGLPACIPLLATACPLFPYAPGHPYPPAARKEAALGRAAFGRAAFSCKL